jgi:hypothetical protein
VIAKGKRRAAVGLAGEAILHVGSEDRAAWAARIALLVTVLCGWSCGARTDLSDALDGGADSRARSDATKDAPAEIAVPIDVAIQVDANLDASTRPVIDAASDVTDGGCPLPLDATVTATLHITVDNQYVLYVNGNLINSTVYDWGSGQRYTVDLFRYPSRRNTIAVQGTNTSNIDGPDRGVIADTQFDAGGGLQHVVTDAAWQVSSVLVPGWYSTGFDASGWGPAVVEGPNGMSPWGSVFGPSSAEWLWSYDSNKPSGAKPVLETIYLLRDFYIDGAGNVSDMPTSSCPIGLADAGEGDGAVSCGGPGETCCAGSSCDPPLKCTRGTCVAAGKDGGIILDARADVAHGVDAALDADHCDGAACACGHAVSFSTFGEDVYLPGVNAVPSTGFTWDYWFNATTLPTSPAVNIAAGATQLIAADGVACEDIHIGFGTSYAPANQLEFNLDGYGGCAARDTTPISYTPPGGWMSHTWYFVTVSHDYGTGISQLYVDGALVASKTAAVLPIPRVLPVTVGRWTDRAVTHYNEFYGTVDEVHIYGRVLSATEVSTEYGAGTGRYGSPTDVGLIAGYHFDDGAGTTAANFAPSGAAGMLEASPAWVPGFVCAM